MLRSLLNQRLGRYYIKELLGRGGMAAVYAATDTLLQRDVALKVLYPQYSDDPAHARRFVREAITAAALEHPHIVSVYDVGEQDGMAYIAMKLLSGQTLQALLLGRGRLEPAELLDLLAPVAAALDYAHSRGVIHRDIKPGNIFLSQAPGGPQVMLTDFGIAKQLDAPGLTTTGVLIGTPDYMAPEQIAGRPVDARTDVYALGMLAYRALTGRRAFEGSAQDVLVGHLYGEPPQPSALAPGLPPALDAVLLRAVAREPAARYQSAGAFVAALRAAAYAAGPGPALLPAALALGAPTPVGVVRPPASRQQPATPTVAPGPAPAGPASAGPWLITIVLALIAGGLAVALGFLTIARPSAAGPAAGLPPAPPSPTPGATAVPTLAPSATDAAAGAPAPATPAPASATLAVPAALPPPTARPSAAPTATAEATAAATATVEPTATAAASATAEPTATAGCADGLLQGGFGQLYRAQVELRTRLGCPQMAEQSGHASEQFFARGSMYYWGLNPTALRDTIVVLYGLDGGAYELVPPDTAAAYPKPPENDDPNAPQRGFGRVYFGRPDVAERLGAWTSPEIELKGDTAGVIQSFAGGTMIYTPDYRQPGGARAIFVLYADGTFERYNDPLAG